LGAKTQRPGQTGVGEVLVAEEIHMALLTVGEVAKRLGISAYTVREKIANGELNAVHVGREDAKRRTLRVTSDEVERFVRLRRGDPEPHAGQPRMSPERRALRAMATRT
jgi:excisionase family DNA binding protein